MDFLLVTFEVMHIVRLDPIRELEPRGVARTAGLVEVSLSWFSNLPRYPFPSFLVISIPPR